MKQTLIDRQPLTSVFSRHTTWITRTLSSLKEKTMTRLLGTLAVLGCMGVMAATAQAASILIITANTADEAALETFLESAPGGVHAVTLSTGYTGALSPSNIAELNGYDLIIMRTSTNNYYSSGQASDWNALSTPILVTAVGLVAQNGSRWNWIGRDAGATTSTSDGILEVDVPGHPVYTGVSVVGGQMTLYSPGRTITHFPTGAGNAEVVASSTAATARPLLAFWEEGEYFRGTSGQIAGGPRGYFPLPSGDVMTDMTDDGKRLLANTVDYIIPEPASLVLLAAGGLLMMPRRRPRAYVDPCYLRSTR